MSGCGITAHAQGSGVSLGPRTWSMVAGSSPEGSRALGGGRGDSGFIRKTVLLLNTELQVSLHWPIPAAKASALSEQSSQQGSHWLARGPGAACSSSAPSLMAQGRLHSGAGCKSH